MRYLASLVAFALAFLPFSASATPSFVKVTQQNTACSSCTLAFNPTNAGDTLVIYVTNGTDNGTDSFSSATWNGGAITPTDRIVTGTIGGGDCVSPAIAPAYEFVVQNVTTGSQNFVMNWSASKNTPISIAEYTGVAATGQPATHTSICKIDNPTLTATVTSGNMLITGGGIFSSFPTACPGGWAYETLTNCTSITQNSFLSDVVATTTSVSVAWQGTTLKMSMFLVSLTATAAAVDNSQFDQPVFFQ